MKIIILTANEERHKFFRRYLNNHKNINVSLAICEDNKERQYFKVLNSKKSTKLQKLHFKNRIKSEKIFFSPFNKSHKDPANTLFVKRWDINKKKKYFKKNS